MVALSIKTKMTLMVSVLVAFMLSVMAFLILAAVEKEMRSSIEAQQETLASAMVAQLDYKISLYRDEVLNAAKSIAPELLERRSGAQRIVENRFDTISMFDGGVFLYAPDGTLIAGSTTAPGAALSCSASGLDVAETIRLNGARISEPYSCPDDDGRAMITFSAPVPGKDGRAVAVLVGKLDLSKQNFLTETAKLKIGKSGYFRIFNHNKVPVTAPAGQTLAALPASASAVFDKAINGTALTEERVNRKGVPVLSTFRRLNSTGWVLSANFPLQEAYDPIRRTKQRLAAALILMVAASFVVVRLAMRHLMAPLLSFTRQVLALSGDEALPKPVRIDSHDEIEGLATAFNTLMEDLSRHKHAIVEEKDFQASLLQHSSLPTFVIDRNHRLLHWNRACETMTGTSASDLVGTEDLWRVFFHQKRPVLADLVVEKDAAQLAAYYPNHEKRGDAIHAEGWYNQFNGKELYLSFYAAPIYSRSGEVIAAIETIEDITHRKRGEEELRKLSCAVEQSPNAVVIADTNGEIEYVNPKFSALTGFSLEEVVGQKPQFLQFGEMSPDLSNEVWNTITSGREWRGEFLSRKKNGEPFWERVSISPVKTEEGEITHYVAVKEDITAQREATDKIRHSVSMLNATLESTADGILVRDLEGRLRTYNRRLVEMWGLPEELLTTGEDRVLRAYAVEQTKDPAKFVEVAERLYAHPELDSSDVFELKDGRVFERVSRPQLVGNEIVGRVVSFRDITERKRAEEALRESAERYRSLVENIDLGITLIDTNHRIIMTNSAAARMIMTPADALVQRECFRMFEKRSAVCPHCPGEVAMRTGQPATVQTEGVRDDGSTVPCKIKAFPVFGADGRASGFIEVIQDITEQIQAEADKKHLEEQLRQSQKMEALGTLAGGIAHDFNNILTAICAYASLIQRKIEAESPLAQYLDKLTASTDRASALTQSLLAYSRKQTLNPQPVNLNEVIGKTGHLLSRLLGEDIELSIVLAGDALTVLADSPQLGQVLMNLATNARDAMPDGGSLRIATGRMELDADYVRIQGFGRPGSYALLTVTDSGSGMDAGTLERIFEPFYTTKEIGKGTGLGLSVVYGIVKQHCGHITVQSERGQGTTFTLYLPLTDQAQQSLPLQLPPPKRGDETILLVEDDSEIRACLKELLEEDGYRIIEAVDGEDGVEKFMQHKEAVQLLLVDVVMPKKNGRIVYEEIKAVAPGMKALFISGYTADILDAKGVLQEQWNFIPKPIAVGQLLLKMREVLDGVKGDRPAGGRSEYSTPKAA